MRKDPQTRGIQTRFGVCICAQIINRQSAIVLRGTFRGDKNPFHREKKIRQFCDGQKIGGGGTSIPPPTKPAQNIPTKKTGYDYFGNVAHIKRMPYPPPKEQSKKNTPKGRNRGKRQKTAKFDILPHRTTLDIPKDTKRQIRGGFKGRFSAISVKILPIR